MVGGFHNMVEQARKANHRFFPWSQALQEQGRHQGAVVSIRVHLPEMEEANRSP